MEMNKHLQQALDSKNQTAITENATPVSLIAAETLNNSVANSLTTTGASDANAQKQNAYFNIVYENQSSKGEVYDEAYCERPWPEIDLLLPVCLTRGRDIRRHYEVETLFLRSLFLFWTLKLSNTSLVAVVDEELIGIDLLDLLVRAIQLHAL